jgi:hypothetical protein
MAMAAASITATEAEEETDAMEEVEAAVDMVDMVVVAAVLMEAVAVEARTVDGIWVSQQKMKRVEKGERIIDLSLHCNCRLDPHIADGFGGAVCPPASPLFHNLAESLSPVNHAFFPHLTHIGVGP